MPSRIVNAVLAIAALCGSAGISRAAENDAHHVLVELFTSQG